MFCFAHYADNHSWLRQNELVMARLRHEELESELVRYKLLYVLQGGCSRDDILMHRVNRYAEAMHENEDALSSHRMSRMSIFSRRSSGNNAS